MRAWAMPLATAAALIAAGLVWRWIGFDVAAMLPDRGFRGVAVFVAVGSAVLLLGLPRQAVAFAGGAEFGAAAGGALAWAAAMISCAIAFAVVRAAWRRPPTPPSWFRRAQMALRRKPFAATLVLRLLPVGHNMMLTMASAALRVRAAPFLVGSAAGYLPQTVVFALLGDGVALGRAGAVVAGAGLLAASILGGLALMRADVLRDGATDVA